MNRTPTFREFLVEPPRESPLWLSAIYGRLRGVQEGIRPDPEGVGRSPVAIESRRRSVTGEPAGDLPGFGAASPALVVVGDRSNASTVFPFLTRSGYHLWAALRLLGWDELTVRVVNARGREGGRPADLDEIGGRCPGALWLILGFKARQVVRRSDLPGIDLVEVDHPGRHLQKKRADGPDGYARHMASAGLARVGPPLLPVPAEEDPWWYSELAPAPVPTYPEGSGWPPPDEREAPETIVEAAATVERAEPSPLEKLAAVATATAGHALRSLATRVARGQVVLSFEQTVRLGDLAAKLAGATGGDVEVAALAEAQRAVDEVLGVVG